LLNEWAQKGPSDPARRIDLILVTRGGGSLEDLWAFNEEVVARAIVESRIPVVSAVGHEIDFTISDFAADFRAATPTAAAEIITESYFASRQFVSEMPERLAELVRARLKTRREFLEFLAQRLHRQHPRRWLQEQWQRLDDLQNSLGRCVRYGYRLQQTRCGTLSQRLLRVRPSQLVARRRAVATLLWQRCSEGMRRRWRERVQGLRSLDARLRLLSPHNVLERGYSITMDAATGRVLRSKAEVQPGQRLTTRLQESEITSVVQL
jgi:exodeoxyribonuclease VII large subunit